ncbi:MAG: biliverdin-producing heme oxygenase [Leptospirales bacterium]|jgi:heme oxygenase
MTNLPDLATHLREATAEAHASAEGGTFVRRFMKGELDRATYQSYLVAMRDLYAALEAGLAANRDHAALKALSFPELPRKDAIASDLAFFETPADLPAPPAAVEYAKHLEAIAAENPVLLVAHSYVRYLGDLSGGQALAKAVQRTFGLSGDDGIAFYRFAEIENLADFKNVYRAALDHLPLSDAEHQAVVEEAKTAFALNGRVFADLSPDLAAGVES